MRKYNDSFELTEQLLTLLRHSNVSEELSELEWGAAQVDPKRPYGNGNLVKDIVRILGFLPPDFDYDEDVIPDAVEQMCVRLHEQTPLALAIVLSTGEFRPGLYHRTEPYGSEWVRVDTD